MNYNHSIIVFVGPSIRLAKAKQILPDALYCPPIKCGDILHALKWQPQKIAIIDGYFENVAAVWHKEILFALSQPIKVYGASSMGALRAAELADFGMIGIGKIFEDFYQGRLEADDEVTVVHRPAQSDYVPVTDAMVNIRATLEKAVAQNMLSLKTVEKLTAIAKNLFYKKRLLSIVIDIFEAENPVLEIQAFRDWLKAGNFVDQKEKDAVTLLEWLKKTDQLQKQSYTLSLNRSIVLQKLLDRHYCEPQEGDRYIRLLAYTLKTCERLDLLDAMRNMEEAEIMPFFYGLLLLFDPQLDKNTRYFKILLFCAGVIFKVYALMKNKNIFLTDNQKKYYWAELKGFLPLIYDDTLASDEYLIVVYFVLKDIINNSMDCFLVNHSKNKRFYIDKDYVEMAQQILCVI